MARRQRSFTDINDRLFLILLATAGLLAVFAVIAQHDMSLFTGFLKIQFSETGLITDPCAIGGVGAALLNASLLLFGGVMLIRRMELPFTGVSFACLYMMGGFALLGKNLVNVAPILLGGWLFSKYERKPFSTYVYLVFFSTCLAPMVSYLLANLAPGYRWPAAMLTGVILGFLVPAVAGYTIRIHQGYNLYNVGFASGFVGLGAASILKGFGVDFKTEGSWSTEGHLLLAIMVAVLLLGLLAAGIAMGCRSFSDYRRIVRHSGRAVADYILLDGPGRTFVNMAVVGGIGYVYLLCLYPFGVRLNGPLVCCIFSLAGFAAFGKHPKNILPVMAGAILACLIMVKVPTVSPGVLLATLLSTCLAPIAGQFGWYWGVAAGFLHMTIVQNTAFLHGGMNLYNNGFAAGLVCVLLVPVIEALKPVPKE